MGEHKAILVGIGRHLYQKLSRLKLERKLDYDLVVLDPDQRDWKLRICAKRTHKGLTIAIVDGYIDVSAADLDLFDDMQFALSDPRSFDKLAKYVADFYRKIFRLEKEGNLE